MNLNRNKEKKAIAVYLDVIVRIPIRVIDDDGISSGEVDPQTAGPC